ncbi:MAG: hypothetical protein QM831_33240 [Kofleriaceae bacterium]
MRVWLVWVAACATPYQAMGFRGGYEEHRLPDGAFAVHVRVNGYTDAGTALEYAYRRSTELCPGGFTALGGEQSQSTSYLVNRNSVQQIDKPEVTFLIRCNAAVSPPAEIAKSAPTQPQTSAREVVIGSSALWCSTDGAVDKGRCFIVRDECVAFHVQTTGTSDCLEKPAGSCFNAIEALDGKHVRICAPSISDCEARLSLAKESPDYQFSVAQCDIYRADPKVAGTLDQQ